MGDLETFLDEFMLKKAVNALVTSSVVFYIKYLLERAENITIIELQLSLILELHSSKCSGTFN